MRFFALFSMPLRAVSVAVLGVCGALPATFAQAPTPSPGHNSLPTIVVSGSRQEQLADDLPISSDTVNSQEISDRQSADLRQALQQLPNIYVKSNTIRPNVTATTTGNAWRDGNLGINIRGLGGNRVLMLVDGIRMPRGYAARTNAFDREYLALEQLKRIEIIRGPASALYGSDGLAGLVNYITHDPADFLRDADGQVSKTLGGRVAAGWTGDDHGYAFSGTVAGKASDSAQWLLSASTRRAHELETRGSNASANELRTLANPERSSNATLLGKLVLRPDGRQRHVLTAEHVQKKTDIDLLSSRSAHQPLKTGDVSDEQYQQQAERDRLSWDARFGLQAAWADHLRTVLSWQKSAADLHSSSVRLNAPLRVRDISYDDQTWQLGVQADKVIRSGSWAHRIDYGVDFSRSRIGNLWDGLDPLPPEKFPLKRFPDTRDTSSAAYVQLESVSGNWTFTPGLRFDHFSIDVTSQAGFYPPAKQPGESLSGSALSPKFGVLYRATSEWSLFGQYASGFRAPEPGHLNGYLEVDKVNATVLSNPNLKPEKSRGLELGTRARMQRLSLDASVFANHYANLISELEVVSSRVVPGAPGTPPKVYTDFQTLNKARARITGWEVKGAYDWGVIGNGRLRSDFSYGQTRGVDRDTGKPINSIAPAQLTLGLRYDTAAWTWTADLRQQAAKKAKDIDSGAYLDPKNGVQFAPPAFALLDLGAQWRVRKDLRVNVALSNVTNRKYWLWPDVHGRAGTAADIDAYTQAGRAGKGSLVMDF